jgi:hypothetical protein
VATWTNKRIKDEVKINWQFSKEKAREKFDKKYQKFTEIKLRAGLLGHVLIRV